ncbi:PHP domain-like protein [Desarmillaria tabescens]|uniref:PHP domain-like protein n=1 Tax=Armillaria tabescens TaxID=1929756 RepID=A0AA39N5U9_ARMTA|nr:PHP domain-like protein [Desarmillaria tabescens]KAK0458539.1 PHP domain-like protein [Desarmillaria tabescens]
MYDLNIPISLGENGNKKGKGKQAASTEVRYTAAQISAIESRIDMLCHLGYNVIAFTQTVAKKVYPKTHVNILDPLLGQLTPRKGMVYLKRLSIILDSDSEKGFGLINAQTTLFNTYDLLSLIPTNQATLSLACLTHSLPSPLTAHIISLPLTLPRLPFHLKHTLIRTAIKNGAVFEITYVGALGGENDATIVDANAAENGASAKRNWWGAARELTRVCKGKDIIVSSGAVSRADLRAPGDIGNLITLLDVPQDVAHSSMTKTPKSLVLRAQTRKTHRAVLSEPRLVIPEGYQPLVQPPETTPSVQANDPTLMANKRPRDEQEGSKKKKRKKSKQDGSA